MQCSLVVVVSLSRLAAIIPFQIIQSHFRRYLIGIPERGRQSYATVKQTREILAAFNAEAKGLI